MSRFLTVAFEWDPSSSKGNRFVLNTLMDLMGRTLIKLRVEIHESSFCFSMLDELFLTHRRAPGCTHSLWPDSRPSLPCLYGSIGPHFGFRGTFCGPIKFAIDVLQVHWI
jgi:hypothetical protein